MSDDKGPLVLAIVILTVALGGVFVFARVITRTLLKPQFGWDDSLIILSWLFILANSVAVIVSVGHGYGKHAADIAPSQLMPTLHAFFAYEVLVTASYPVGKASVAYLLSRLFPGKKLHYFLWITIALNTIVFWICSIIFLAQCRPLAFNWDRSIPGGYCWTADIITGFGIFTGAVGAATDFVFAIIPWYYLSGLQMGLKEKISIGIALSIGVFAGACSIVKTYYLSKLAAADPTYDTAPLVYWAAAELCVITIAACIPTLRPLYRRIIGKGAETTEDKSYETPKVISRRKPNTFRRFGLFSVDDEGSSRLESGDDYDRNIYRLRDYTVSVEQDGKQSSRDSTAAIIEPHALSSEER